MIPFYFEKLCLFFWLSQFLYHLNKQKANRRKIVRKPSIISGFYFICIFFYKFFFLHFIWCIIFYLIFFFMMIVSVVIIIFYLFSIFVNFSVIYFSLSSDFYSNRNTLSDSGNFASISSTHDVEFEGSANFSIEFAIDCFCFFVLLQLISVTSCLSIWNIKVHVSNF